MSPGVLLPGDLFGLHSSRDTLFLPTQTLIPVHRSPLIYRDRLATNYRDHAQAGEENGARWIFFSRQEKRIGHVGFSSRGRRRELVALDFLLVAGEENWWR